MSCGYEVDNEPITPRVQRIQKLRGYAWAEKGHIRDRWIRASMIYFAVYRLSWLPSTRMVSVLTYSAGIIGSLCLPTDKYVYDKNLRDEAYWESDFDRTARKFNEARKDAGKPIYYIATPDERAAHAKTHKMANVLFFMACMGQWFHTHYPPSFPPRAFFRPMVHICAPLLAVGAMADSYSYLQERNDRLLEGCNALLDQAT